MLGRYGDLLPGYVRTFDSMARKRVAIQDVLCAVSAPMGWSGP